VESLGERLEQIAGQARHSFDEVNAAREKALSVSRELIRTSANSIRASHRAEWDTAAGLIQHAGELAEKLRALRTDRSDLYWAGYTQDALKEFVEARCVFALVKGQDLPDAGGLGVPWAAYLNGLGEAASEMRRYCLDTLRSQRTDQAEQALDAMDAIYSILVTIDYPDALTGGLRRTTDLVRAVLERTRADVTSAVLQGRMAGQMQQLMDRLDGQTPAA
jgi:translin